MNTLKHIELKGGYTCGRKIIIDICELAENEFEVMAMYENDGQEIDCINTDTKEKALSAFDELIMKHAEPLQKAVYNAKLQKGEKYTLAYLSEFGFPIIEKITFESFDFQTYAQYSDVVKMVFKPFRKRNLYSKCFYNNSLMIFEGWQEVKESDMNEVLRDDGKVKTLKSKYGCFDSNYIEDIEKLLKNPVVIYKNYKTGVNGKVYA